ncbi:MAG: HD domain-containing protein [Burkholderiales bacterium]|nr:HD domain-containing protein [Burkholderiales bacterium]
MRSMLHASPLPDLPDPPGENPHYLRAISELGEQQEIVLHDDIYAKNGMKLLAKGARIDRKQFDRLVQHKLNISIDQALALQHTISATELAREASKVLEISTLMQQLATRSGDALAVKHELARLTLPPQLLTRLTVMRETRPELFQHSLRTAMIAFMLGQRLGLPAAELPLALMAGLCHDMGELHTDPALLMTEHRIAPEERRYVHVHPITAYCLLSDNKEVPPAVVKAVLQHHERLDGSGYPYALKSAQISDLGKLLAVADLAEAGSDRFESHRMDMLLRVSRNRFAPEILNALRELIHLPEHEQREVFADLDLTAELEKLAKIFDAWQSLKVFLETQADNTQHGAVDFLFERMDSIRSLILQAGFDPEDIHGIEAIAGDDAQILTELRDMLSEIDWLLRDLANEIDRRKPVVDGVSQVALSELVTHLRLTRLTGSCVIWPSF